MKHQTCLVALALAFTALLGTGRAQAQGAVASFAPTYGGHPGTHEVRHREASYRRRHQDHGTRRTWVAGHYEERRHPVWVKGDLCRVWVPPVFEFRGDGCGREVRVCVRGGCWEERRGPGRWETRCERVWVPGCWR